MCLRVLNFILKSPEFRKSPQVKAQTIKDKRIESGQWYKYSSHNDSHKSTPPVLSGQLLSCNIRCEAEIYKLYDWEVIDLTVHEPVDNTEVTSMDWNFIQTVIGSDTVQF